MSGQQDGRFTEGAITWGDRTVSIKVIIGLLILVGITFFVVQNTQDVAFTWLFFRFEMPLWGLTLVLFIAGLLMGWALHLRRAKRRAG